MSTQAHGGTVIYMSWTPQRGLAQTSAAFSSLDELFALCLDSGSGSKGHVEEIYIHGADAEGHARQVTLTFRAASRPAK